MTVSTFQPLPAIASIPRALTLAFSLCLAAPLVNAAPLKQAKVTQVVNDVNLLPNQAQPKRATINDEVTDGTAVRTGVESRSELTFTDQTIARLGANTIFNFNEGTRSMELGGGAILLRVPKGAGGAKITTSAVTAAITGTTVMMQFDAKGYAKFIVLEGEACMFAKADPSNCVPVKAGQLLTVRVNPPPTSLPAPIDIDLSRLIDSAGLLSNDFGALPSMDLIQRAIEEQEPLKTQADAGDRNARAAGDIVLASLSDMTTAIDQRTAVEVLTSPTPTPASSPTPPPTTPTPPPSTPTPPPSTPTPPPSTPTPTPTKFGTPPVITSSNPYPITAGTVIRTDPTITTNGVTDEGRIFRNRQTDGPRSSYLFGSTSSFDNEIGVDAVDLDIFAPFAAFKFQSLQLLGNPTINTSGGGPTILVLVGINGLTSGSPGGTLTFSGLDALLLATQNGSINLGPEVSFNGIARLFLYARGAGSSLTIGSTINAPADLRLFSQGSIAINGALSSSSFIAISGGDFLGGGGLVTTRRISIRSLANINFNSDNFSIGAFSNTALTLRADGSIDIDGRGDQSVFNNARSVTVEGETINLLADNPYVITFNSSAAPSFTAGTGGLQGPDVGLAGNNISLVSAGDIRIHSFDSGGTLSGSIDAAGDFSGLGDFTLSDLSAGGSITIGGNIIASTITAGATINLGGRLAAFDSVTAGGDITADTVAVPNIVTPGILRATGGGILPFVVTPGGSDVQHTFTVKTIVSPNGIDFSGNQFDGIDELFAGGKLTINADTLRFDATDGIGGANFDGADGFGTTHPSPDGKGGDGGTFIVNATGDIFVGERLSATTGLNDPDNPDALFGGAGGRVELNSESGVITITNTIEVSSNDDLNGRRSASGGNISIRSGATEGVAIRIQSSAQLLSLLDSSAPGPGGTISISADTTGNNNSTMEIDNSQGAIAAFSGTIDIRHLGDQGGINLNSANLFADVIKIGALGEDGTLTIGGGSISADTLLRLYAGGSNGSILFTANVTLNSGSVSVLIAAHQVTIANGMTVTIGGSDPASVFTDLANYTGSGGNNFTTGTFAGAGANTFPFSDAPPFDSSADTELATYSSVPNGNWSDAAVWNPMVVPNNDNGGRNYDAVINGGTVTQDIASGVTIEQLFMNSGTLRLTNPLSLNRGLQFTGGGITLGTLDIDGNSSQSAPMTVNGTTFNNFGTYQLDLAGGDIFSGGGSTFNNSGTLTKPSGAGAIAFNLPLNNTGLVGVSAGTLQLTAGGSSSGIFSADPGAVLEIASDYTFFNGAGFSGSGQIRLNNNHAFRISGAITNDGNVLLNAAGNFTDLLLTGNTTLTGSGSLTLVNSSRVRGSGILTNASTIGGETTGGGSFGANEIGIANQAAGIIEANRSGLGLDLDPNSAFGLTNAGTLRASSGGLLVLNGNGGGTFDNTGGIISALDASEVQLVNGAAITGGTLSSSGSGVIRTLNSASLSDLSITGLFRISNNTNATFTGSINNSGVIHLAAGGNFTDLLLGADTTFVGGGTINLQNAARVRGNGTLFIGDINGGAQTIQGETNGGGGLGANEIGIVLRAASLIDANVSGLQLNLDPGAALGLTNQGTLRASSGGVLVLNGNGGGAFDNQGSILALDGSEVQLANGVSITGGLLNTFGSGVIRTLNSASLASLANAGVLRVSNNTSLALSGFITNDGSITLASSGNFTDLLIDNTVVLAGMGSLNLQDAARVRGGGMLFNGGASGEAHLIQGETNGGGSLGANELALVNRSGGLVDANVNGKQLVVDPRASEGLVNQGIMQASGGGLLLLTGNGAGTFFNNGGTIRALDGSQVQLTSGVTISGGTLATSGTGTIHNISSATLDSVFNTGSFIADNNTTTILTGTLTNSGSFLLNSTGNFTDLLINGNVTLTGSSALTLQNAARVRGSGTLNIGGPSGEAYTIQGETNGGGSLGANELAIVNRSGGLINANVSVNGTGLALVVDPSASTALINQGIMRASNGGILLLTGNGGGSFNNTGGIIEALAGSQVQLTGGAAVSGGTLRTISDGVIRNINDITLLSLTNAGSFIADNNTTTRLTGTITNSGSILLNSSGNFTDLYLNGSVILNGGGTLTLANADRVRGSGILNNISHTIRGETGAGGSLGANEIGISNAATGLIDANVANLALNLDPNATDGLLNAGLMRATNGGILSLTGNGGGAFDNSSGTVIAFDLSQVQLTAGASLSGGLWQTQGTGSIRVIDSATLANLTLGANFIANNNTTTTFVGTINNAGNITFDSQGNFTDLVLGGSVNLTGTGRLFLKNADRVRGSGILTNASTIQGETNSGGSFGTNEIGIVNQAGGLIDANVNGLVLGLDPSSADGLTNNGTMRASNGGILVLDGNGGGTFTNSGTISAVTGGQVRFNGTVNSSGTVDVGSASLTATGNYTQSGGSFLLAGGSVQSTNALIFQGGLVDARGTITAAIQNNAMLRPGLGGSGLSVTGNVSLLSSSQLVFQLGGLSQGTQYGNINVSGNVSLGGQLLVSFVNGFQNSVANGNSFTVLNSTAPLTGAFANVASGNRLEASNAAGSFLVNYNGNSIVLSDYTPDSFRPAPAASTPPEPGESVVTASAETPSTETKVPNRRVFALSAALSSGRERGANSRTLLRAQSPRAGMKTQVGTVKMESSNQLLDLLEEAEPNKSKGKVVIDAKRAAKTIRGMSAAKATRITMNEARDAAGKAKANREASGPQREVARLTPSPRAVN